MNANRELGRMREELAKTSLNNTFCLSFTRGQCGKQLKQSVSRLCAKIQNREMFKGEPGIFRHRTAVGANAAEKKNIFQLSFYFFHHYSKSIISILNIFSVNV